MGPYRDDRGGPVMRPFGLCWWVAACGLALLLATLGLWSRALTLSIRAPDGTDVTAWTGQPPVAEGELVDAPELEQDQPSALPVLTR